MRLTLFDALPIRVTSVMEIVATKYERHSQQQREIRPDILSVVGVETHITVEFEGMLTAVLNAETHFARHGYRIIDQGVFMDSDTPKGRFTLLVL